jgi:hypothetical protein
MKTFGGGRTEEAAAKPLQLGLKGGGTIVLAGFNELCPLKECAEGRRPGANRYTREKAASTLGAIRREKPAAFVNCNSAIWRGEQLQAHRNAETHQLRPY